MTRIIVVDLDGTLISSDTLVESGFLFLRHNPLRIFEPLIWLLKGGKAYLKQKLANSVTPDCEHLPYNNALIIWLKEQRELGARLILATAADYRIAEAVADHLCIFDEVIATRSENLSSHNKSKALVERFGEKGFEYVGNSHDDLAVWESASVIHMVNPEFGVAKAAQQLGVQGVRFDSKQPYLRTVFKALRLHQWAKNVLIFVPLLASHRIFEVQLILNGLIAFFAFGLSASSVYLLNDLLDLPDDRRHHSKRNRPLAAGTLPILHALFFIPTLLIVAFVMALWLLPWQFSAILAAYYVLTLAYSLWLKRIAMLDVVTLSMLYTSRVVAGAAAMSLMLTFWILAFSTFIFLSLALVKRYTELYEARKNGHEEKTAGRGYYPADFELLAALGGASGFISVLVLALYINESATGQLYKSPEMIWLALPLLLFWIGRVWLLAHRGEMHDDPIVFALRDQVSRWTGIVFLVIFGLAAL
jgi:4-hydroxybenzoate polyprenyltransferase